jgi:hypothetical protein
MSHFYRIPHNYSECPECRGRGFFYDDNGPAPSESDCEYCSGTGEIDEPNVVLLAPFLPNMDRQENQRHIKLMRSK